MLSEEEEGEGSREKDVTERNATKRINIVKKINTMIESMNIAKKINTIIESDTGSIKY